MNTLERALPESPQLAAHRSAGLAIFSGTVHFFRLVLFAFLAICEPVVTRLLSAGCLLGLLSWAVFKLEDPAGAHHLHSGVPLTFAIGCVASLVLYYSVMRVLDR
jgi:hypothetical protein